MPLPAEYNTGTVTGTYLTIDGAAAQGTVTFTPRVNRILAATSEKIILPRTISVTLVDGSFSVALPATNDPDISPANFTYRVVETITGGGGSSYDINVLVGTTLDLSTVLSGSISSGGSTIIKGDKGDPGDTTIPDELVAGRGVELTDIGGGQTRLDFDNIQVDTITTVGSNTITIPSWARLVHITCIGGGGGGGGGRRGAAASLRGGGGGGQSGGFVAGWFRPEHINNTTVIVGAGGAGGAGGATDSSNGSNGTSGGGTSVYRGGANLLIEAPPGVGGGGGTTEGGTGGGLASFSGTTFILYPTGQGQPGLQGAGAAAAQSLVLDIYAKDLTAGPYAAGTFNYEWMARMMCRGNAAAGGGGGGITAANAITNPSAAATVYGVGILSHVNGAAGTVGSKNGAQGVIVAGVGTNYLIPGAGGGGGYASDSGAAGTGGAGIGYGAPGGGGGASLNGNAAGAGGAGTSGAIRLIWVA